MGQSTNPMIGRLASRWRLRLRLSLEAALQLKRGLFKLMLHVTECCILMSLLSLAQECVCILMHVTVCAFMRLAACLLIQLLFGFKIKTTEHMNLNVGFQGLCKHACQHDYIGGFYFAPWSVVTCISVECAFMLPCSCV